MLNSIFLIFWSNILDIYYHILTLVTDTNKFQLILKHRTFGEACKALYLENITTVQCQNYYKLQCCRAGAARSRNLVGAGAGILKF
jgi:hypothetical protein